MLIYKWLIDNNTKVLDEELDNIIQIIEKYKLFSDYIFDFYGAVNNYIDAKVPVISKKVENDRTIYNIYYENFHFHFALTNNETVFSIRLKESKDRCSWEFDNCNDISHPKNINFEVYVWYNLPVLNITRSVGYSYKHGAWDEYFYKTMKKFKQYFEQFKEENIVAKSYKS